MASVTLRYLVKRPLKDVFDYVADTRNDAKWAPMVEHVRQVEGDGPGAGAKYLVAQRVAGGRVVDMELTMVSYVRPAELAWEAGKRVRFDMAFAPSKEGTLVIQRNAVNLGSPVRNLVWRLVARRVMRKQVRNLRAILEG